MLGFDYKILFLASQNEKDDFCSLNLGTLKAVRDIKF